MPKRFFSVACWLVAAVFCLLVAVFAAEYTLRRQAAAIKGSDRQYPGLIRYDPVLGWRLTPGWQGSHRHREYQVRYTTDNDGRRNAATPFDLPFTAVVGDSFTFGLGVNDSETFVALLNRTPGDKTYVNYGVPGYSNDQELLQIERDILPLKPREILLVVYLGNDIFDNTLPFPLQAMYAKPFFSLAGLDLELKNQPVPLVRTEPDYRQKIDTFLPPRRLPAVLTPVAGRFLVVSGLLNRFSPPPREIHFPPTVSEALKLFDAILTRTERSCRKNGSTLRLALLGGGVLLNKPASLSAHLQEHLRRAILPMAQAKKIPVIDLVAAMRQTAAGSTAGQNWYYPHEGHLTASGHRLVAQILDAHLKQKK